MNRITCAAVWFFHQCDVPLVSGADLAGLVHDRHRAIAGVFDDLAFRHIDQRRAVVMAVPRHDAAGLDHHLAEAQLAAGDLRLLLAEIDRAERGVGHALGRMIDRLGGIRHALVGRAFAGLRAGREAAAARNASAATAPARLVKLDIVISFVSLWLASSNAAGAKMPRATSRDGNAALALISIASRYFTPPRAACIFVDQDALSSAQKQRITS